MAARSYKQFFYSQERQPVMLMGAFAQDGSTGTFASLVANSVTYTAKQMGSAGNSITVKIIDGAVAGAEVVSVSGNAISIQIQDGVSTNTQLVAAVQASVPASALISISTSSGATAAALQVATPLAGGVDTVFVSNAKDMTLLQTDTGVYKLSLQDGFFALLYVDASLQTSSAKDLDFQIASSDVLEPVQEIVIRSKAGSSETDMADTDIMFVQVILRNSGD
jgi:hypothetical protein